MRRNLTLEEAGVLDLRKFINSNEAVALWESDHLIHIPIDWCYAIDGTIAITDSTSALWFFQNRFNSFIIEMRGGLVYMPAVHESYICSDNYSSAFNVSEVNADDNYIELEWVEI